MANTVVSIVVPAYNAEEYIGDAIRSTLKQSYTNLEIVVVDDGSTDNTVQVVEEVCDPRLRLLRQENQGQSVAINNGVKYSSGNYIKILDADDWLNPEHIEEQLKAVEKSPDMLASSRWGYFIEDFARPSVKAEFTNQHYDDPLEWVVDSLTRDEGMMGGWMWLIPREIWEKSGGYDDRLGQNNDFHFSIQLLLASKGVRFADRAIYSYRKGINQALSASSGDKAMESAFLTTLLATSLLLEREDSIRIRKICADRFQQWLFKFYPEYPGLVSKTEMRIAELGGSNLEMMGGQLLRLFKPLIGWKGVRWLQFFVYQHGWQWILGQKENKRLKQL